MLRHDPYIVNIETLESAIGLREVRTNHDVMSSSGPEI